MGGGGNTQKHKQKTLGKREMSSGKMAGELEREVGRLESVINYRIAKE